MAWRPMKKKRTNALRGERQNSMFGGQFSGQESDTPTWEDAVALALTKSRTDLAKTIGVNLRRGASMVAELKDFRPLIAPLVDEIKENLRRAVTENLRQEMLIAPQIFTESETDVAEN